MSCLYQRGGVWWLQIKDRGYRARRSLRTKSLPEARRIAREIEREVTKWRVLRDLGVSLPEMPQNNALQCPTFNDHGQGGMKALPIPLTHAWQKYAAWAKAHLRPGSVEQVTISWRLFMEFSKARTAADITTASVERFQVHLRKAGRSEATIHNKIKDVGSVISRMIALGVFPGVNPVAGVGKVKVPKLPPKFLEPAQVDALLMAAQEHGPDMHLFCGLCVLAGLRKGEAIAARWEWFDVEQKTVTVQAGHGFVPKDRDCRTIPLSDRLLGILTTYQRSDGYLIVPDKEPGQWRYRVEVKKPYAAVIRAAGLEWCTPHTLRHTFASQLVQAGVSLYKVQQWLGHSDPETTMVYSHLASYDDQINGVK